MMSWEKNAFSYVCWFLYAVLTGTALLCHTGFLAECFKLRFYWSIIIGLLWGLCIAVIVVLVHRASIEISAHFGGRRVLEGMTKAIMLIIIATIGLYLRMRTIDSVELMAGESALAIMAELVLQMVTSFLLFFILYKLSGYFCGFITFGFMMCAPGMIQLMTNHVAEMLGLLLLLVVFGFMVIGYRNNLCPALFVVYGALAAFASCIDIAGVLLFCIMIALVFVNRRIGATVGRRVTAVCCSIVGFVLGLSGCLFVESLLGEMVFVRLLFDWSLNFTPREFGIPFAAVNSNSFVETCVLICFMIFGIYSFWYDRKQDRIAFATLLLCGLMAMNCFGVEGKMISGSLLIYLLMVVLAGVGVQQAICGLCVPREILISEEAMDEAMADKTPDENWYEDKTVDGISDVQETKKIQFIENPLPLPKKHKKRVLDYDIPVTVETSDYDIKVAEEDDFDIK